MVELYAVWATIIPRTIRVTNGSKTAAKIPPPTSSSRIWFEKSFHGAYPRQANLSISRCLGIAAKQRVRRPWRRRIKGLKVIEWFFDNGSPSEQSGRLVTPNSRPGQNTARPMRETVSRFRSMEVRFDPENGYSEFIRFPIGETRQAKAPLRLARAS